MYNSSCTSATSRLNKKRRMRKCSTTTRNSGQPDQQIHSACKPVAFRTSHGCHNQSINQQKETSLKNSRRQMPPNFQIKPIIIEPPLPLRAESDALAKIIMKSRAKSNQREIKQMITVHADQPTLSTIRRYPEPFSYHPAPWS